MKSLVERSCLYALATFVLVTVAVGCAGLRGDEAATGAPLPGIALGLGKALGSPRCPECA